MIRVAILAVAALAVAPSDAQPDRAHQARIERMLAGRQALPIRQCIHPDRTVQAEVMEGTGLIYHDARLTYVGKLRGGCPQLRETRRFATISTGGQLCRNDPVRVFDESGAGLGFCTFEGFTPYAKR